VRISSESTAQKRVIIARWRISNIDTEKTEEDNLRYFFVPQIERLLGIDRIGFLSNAVIS